MQTNTITTQQQQSTITFVTVPTIRAPHSIIGIYKRERDTVGCIATYPVELVLAFNASQQEALDEWIELADDLSYAEWLDSLHDDEPEMEFDPRWSDLADVTYDEYRERRLG